MSVARRKTYGFMRRLVLLLSLKRGRIAAQTDTQEVRPALRLLSFFERVKGMPSCRKGTKSQRSTKMTGDAPGYFVRL